MQKKKERNGNGSLIAIQNSSVEVGLVRKKKRISGLSTLNAIYQAVQVEI